jgi:hypothetical protein
MWIRNHASQESRNEWITQQRSSISSNSYVTSKDSMTTRYIVS